MRVNDKYEALLRRAISEVGEGGTLPAGQKMALADFRQRHGITTWMHNKALEDLGWTAEDYNSGARFDRDRAHKALKTLSKKLQPRIDSVPGAAVQEVRKEVDSILKCSDLARPRKPKGPRPEPCPGAGGGGAFWDTCKVPFGALLF